MSVDFQLYLITDRTLFPAQCHMYMALETILEAGVKAVQLREKDLSQRDLFDMAVWMRSLTREYHAHLFLNDRVDIAVSVQAEGVHLGQNSLPVSAVKKIAGEELLIGVSAHSADEALQAERDGADFITLGPLYGTPSKLTAGRPLGTQVLRRVKAQVSIPVFGVGGIRQAQVREVRQAGADGIALITGILGSNAIRETAEEFLRMLR